MGMGNLNPGCICCDCVACSVEQFNDAFGGSWPGTYTDETCGSPTYKSATNSFSISSGQLVSTVTGPPYAGAARNSVTLDSGWSCISLQVTTIDPGFSITWATAGMFLYNAFSYYVRNSYPNTLGRNGVGADLCSTRGVSSQVFTGARLTTDILLMSLRKVSQDATYGYWNVQYCCGGVLAYEELNVPLVLSDPLIFGLFYTRGSTPVSGADAVKFDNLILKAS